MKKIIATTALATFFITNAHAGDLNASVGGTVYFEYGNVSEKAPYKSTKQNSTAVTSGRAVAKAHGKADNGMEYGGTLELRTFSHDATSAASRDNTNKTYLWASNDMGRVELGSIVSPSRTMAINAANIASATGGIDGNWNDYITPGKVGMGNFMVAPDNFFSKRDAFTNANKIAYYSPLISGFQFGVSYAPNTNSNTAKVVRDKEGYGAYSFAKDHLGVGAQLHQIVGDTDIKFGATYESGRAAKIGGAKVFRDLKSWNIGGSAKYSVFKVGGSYGQNGKLYRRDQFISKIANGNDNIKEKDTKYWTAGVGVEQGPMTASFTYMTGKRLNDETNLYSIGADYKLAEGLVPYIEASFFELKPSESIAMANKKGTTKNRGSVFLAGMMLKF